MSNLPHAKPPSNRSFGLMFVAIMIGMAIWEFLKDGTHAQVWAIAAFLLLLTTIFRPSLLTRANRLWMQLGEFLGKIISPVVIGGMYFILIAPAGIIMRLAGRDPLRLSYDRTANSYWITRESDTPTPDTFRNQF